MRKDDRLVEDENGYGFSCVSFKEVGGPQVRGIDQRLRPMAKEAHVEYNQSSAAT